MNRVIYVNPREDGKATAAAANAVVGRKVIAADGKRYEMYDLLAVAPGPADGLWVLVACDPLTEEVVPPGPAEDPGTARAWEDMAVPRDPAPVQIAVAPVGTQNSELRTQNSPAPWPPSPGREPGKRPDGTALTEKQLKAIYAIARNACRLSEADVKLRCQDRFGCDPAELTKLEASTFIDALKGEQAA